MCRHRCLQETAAALRGKLLLRRPPALVLPAILADTACDVRGAVPCAPVLVVLNLVGRQDIDCWPTARDGTAPAALDLEMTPS
jgi:hypothetical protein